MFYMRYVLFHILISILSGSNDQAGIYLISDPPSQEAVMLPPPTDKQQALQDFNPICVPATCVTIYRMIAHKQYDLKKAEVEIMRSSLRGATIFEMLDWLNSHELIATEVRIPRSGAIKTIIESLKSGNYVIPIVKEYTIPNSLHTFIIYGVDRGKVMISDSHSIFGFNRFAISADVFQSRWLSSYWKDGPSEVTLVLVRSTPRQIKE